jgi:alpha-ketoglutaric semialdehyde dehydrogenase
MSIQPVLIDGVWRASSGTKTFQALNPATQTPLADVYPVSPWGEIETAVQAAARAARDVSLWPGERFARFLERYADRIEARAAELVALANQETALPVEPRLAKAELPRTTNQLRQAAAAARDGSWRRPIIDVKANIRSVFAPIGPVVVFGPNNFPFAFNGISGGDFAAAVAAGNPVIAKGHSSHPGTTRLFAEEAQHAAHETEMPAGFVQLIYRTDHADGERLVSHPLIGATGYTGARDTGLVLKAAADRAGKPIYLELSSINPVVVLPGALAERAAALADEFTGSCLMGTGQFCTNPGLVFLLSGSESEAFLNLVRDRFAAAPVGTLLGEGVLRHLERGINAVRAAGAEVITGGEPGGGKGVSYRNTLLRVSGDRFLSHAAALQTEAFGNSSLFVFARNAAQLQEMVGVLEGNLTGTIYSATDGRDDKVYDQVAAGLRLRVGRLLNDKMPTGVAVSPAMNHGGPFPATGHPGFTAVGIPTAIQRFAMLCCYDNVRQPRLPPTLQDKNPGKLWRLIDGNWTQGDVA